MAEAHGQSHHQGFRQPVQVGVSSKNWFLSLANANDTNTRSG